MSQDPTTTNPDEHSVPAHDAETDAASGELELLTQGDLREVVEELVGTSDAGQTKEAGLPDFAPLQDPDQSQGPPVPEQKGEKGDGVDDEGMFDALLKATGQGPKETPAPAAESDEPERPQEPPVPEPVAPAPGPQEPLAPVAPTAPEAQGDLLDSLMRAQEQQGDQTPPPTPAEEAEEEEDAGAFIAAMAQGPPASGSEGPVATAQHEEPPADDEPPVSEDLFAPPRQSARPAPRQQPAAARTEQQPGWLKRQWQKGWQWVEGHWKGLIVIGVMLLLAVSVFPNLRHKAEPPATNPPTTPGAPAPGAPAPGAPAAQGGQPGAASGQSMIPVWVNGMQVNIPMDVNLHYGGVREFYHPGPGIRVERVDLSTVDPQALRQVIANQLGATVVAGPSGATIAPNVTLVPAPPTAPAAPTAAPLFGVPTSEIARELGGRVQTLEGDVGTLKKDVEVLKGDVTTLKGTTEVTLSLVQRLAAEGAIKLPVEEVKKQLAFDPALWQGVKQLLESGAITKDPWEGILKETAPKSTP